MGIPGWTKPCEKWTDEHYYPGRESQKLVEKLQDFSTELVTNQAVEHENIRFRNPFNSNNFCYYARVQ